MIWPKFTEPFAEVPRYQGEPSDSEALDEDDAWPAADIEWCGSLVDASDEVDGGELR